MQIGLEASTNLNQPCFFHVFSTIPIWDSDPKSGNRHILHLRFGHPSRAMWLSEKRTGQFLGLRMALSRRHATGAGKWSLAKHQLAACQNLLLWIPWFFLVPFFYREVVWNCERWDVDNQRCPTLSLRFLPSPRTGIRSFLDKRYPSFLLHPRLYQRVHFHPPLSSNKGEAWKSPYHRPKN